MNKKRIAIVACALLSISSAAQATAFATSYGEIYNFIITPSNNITIGATGNNSQASACLPNNNCVTTGGTGYSNAPPAQINLPSYVDNSYATNKGTGTSYAVADASIDSQQLLGAASTQARSFAEGQLLSTTTGNAKAGNSSATVLTAVISAGAPGSVHFQFDANPFIQAFLTNSASPSQAQGNVTMSLSITDNNNITVFSWSPDGRTTGATTGGFISANGFSLNTTVTALPGNEGPLTYQPLSCTVNNPSPCFDFDGTAFLPSSGKYTLNLSMSTTVNLQTTQIPEPGSVLLLGIGMAALATTTRKGRVVKNDRALN